MLCYEGGAYSLANGRRRTYQEVMLCLALELTM